MSVSMALRVPARSGKRSEFSEKDSEISEAMRLTKMAAEPRQVGDSIKSSIDRAAKRLGWSFSRTEDIWRGEARRIDAHEMDALRSIEQERDQASERAERKRYFAQLASLRGHLQIEDPDFHAAHIAALSWVIEHSR